MKKLFSLNFDITDCVLGNELEKVAELMSSKPFSKEAEMADIPSREEMENIQQDKVALVMFHPQLGMTKKYADYNRPLTELNLALLEDKQDILPDEVVKIASSFLKSAARRWKIPFPESLQKYATEDLSSNLVDTTKISENAYLKKLALKSEKTAMEKVASLPDDSFALPSQRKYPIMNENQVKIATAYFDSYSGSLNSKDRLIYAHNVKSAAVKLNVPISEGIEKHASLILDEFNPDLEMHLRIRAGYTRDSEHQDLYDELATKYKELGVMKTAAALEKIDELAGLSHLYNFRIEEPMYIVCGMEKTASITYEGKLVTHGILEKLSGQDLSDIIDNNTKREFSGPDALAVFESLPTPVKDALINKI